MSAGYVVLSKQFNVSVDNVTSSFNIVLLGLGICMSVSNSSRAIRVVDLADTG